MSLIEDFEDQVNLAEILNDAIADKSIVSDQILPILNAILVDKYHYKAHSMNMEETFENFDAISAEVSQWSAIDIVAAYYHPELGVVALNPKIRAHWDMVQTLRKNEMITVYAGAFQNPPAEKTATDAITAFLDILKGAKVKTPAGLLKGSFAPSRPAPRPEAAPAPQIQYSVNSPSAPITASPMTPASAVPAAVPAAPAAPKVPAAPAAPSGAPKKMTPMYGIVVSNELFHNGNVEAWKKIIASYTTKYPGLEVYVFYEGERIHDINTLFKWGKVKHGSTIMISVAGDDIKDVAKLQRYLKQGASHMFEAFLKAPVSAVLNLF